MDTIILKENAQHPIATDRFDSEKTEPIAENLTIKEYVTGEEFRELAVNKVNTFCNKHGIL